VLIEESDIGNALIVLQQIQLMVEGEMKEIFREEMAVPLSLPIEAN